MCFEVFVIRLHLQITYLPYARCKILHHLILHIIMQVHVENSNTYTTFNKINKESCIQVKFAVGVLHVDT